MCCSGVVPIGINDRTAEKIDGTETTYLVGLRWKLEEPKSKTLNFHLHASPLLDIQPFS